MKRRQPIGLLSLVLCGCMHSTLSPSFKPPPRPSPEQVLQALSEVTPRRPTPVLVAITQEPPQLAAFDLKGKPLWQRPVDARSAPVIAGDCVVTREANGVVVRALADGRPRVTLEEDAVLVGADGEGDRVVIAMSFEEPEYGMRSVLVLVEGDAVRWTKALPLAVGVPALTADRVLVPWATHRLSVLDARDGEEAARWYFIGSVLGHARVERDKAYVGQLGLLHVSPDLLELKGDEVEMTGPLLRSLPAQPPLLRDGYSAVAEPASASHRVAIDWRADPEQERGTLHNAAYLRFYRMLFALEADRDAVRFVRAYPHDLVGSDVGAHGVALADTQGTVRWLDREGNERVLAELDRPLLVATLRVGEFAPDGPSDDTAAALSLRQQLFAAAATDDPRLSAARSYAIERLALIDEPEVTAHLIELCNRADSPEGVRRTACGQLPQRKNGEQAVLAALKARLESEDATRSQVSVAPLALAAAAMKLKPAGPILLELFEDLHTPSRDLAALATALGELEYRPASATLDSFLRLHHAEPEGSDLAEALTASATALSSLRGRAAKDALVAVSESPHAAKALRAHASQTLQALLSPPRRQERAVARAKAEDPAKQALKAPKKPRALDAALVERVLSPIQAKLQRCLGKDDDGPKSTRIAVVVDGDGQPEGIFVTPTALQSCVEPLVRKLDFPKTELGRQRITHVVHRRAAELARRK